MSEKDYYRRCLENMYGLRRFGIKLGLDTIRSILDGIGRPQQHFRTVHIAGSNGKGSVASALSTILHLCGYKTGLYTSPHLVRFNERICINNRPVSDRAVLEAYEAVNRLPPGEREPTFFEFTTAMALWIFAEEKADWAVIETGMGGRLDATNLLIPEVSVITNISLEHREYLGNSIAEISREKGGIIKQGKPLVTGAQQEEALAVLRETAAEKNAPFFRMGEHFRAKAQDKKIFHYQGIENHWKDMQTGLSGRYQMDNAALVLAVCEILIGQGYPVSLDQIRKGLLHNRWPGRLEIVSESPRVILDGAHNLDAARVLGDYLKEETADRKMIMVIGILDDKPYREMLDYLLPHCEKVIVCSPKTGRALPAEKLAAVSEEAGKDTEIISDVGNALASAMENAAARDAICVAGSLYVVGEAKEYLEKKGIPSFQREI